MAFLIPSVFRQLVRHARFSSFALRTPIFTSHHSYIRPSTMPTDASASDRYASNYRAPKVNRTPIVIVVSLTLLALTSFTALHDGNFLPLTSHLSDNRRASSDLMVAFSTAPNREVAQKIAEDIVGKRLAAYVNIVPGAESFYWWQGKVKRDQEVLMIIKTRKELIDKLDKAVGDLHPYEVHELIGMDIKGGGEKYLKWVWEETVGKEVGKNS